jgi:general secretion pathway protein G
MKRHLHTQRQARQRGFTFLELLIVMTILAILAMVAIPSFMTNIRRARETRLQHDLVIMRDAIDKYTVDKEKAPQSLQDLVSGGYLRAMPEDPITRSSDSWRIEMESESVDSQTPPGIRNVKSGADGNDLNGKAFSEY